MTQLEQDLTDRLAKSEKDRASWLHQHNVLAGRITAIRAALSYDPKVDRDLETCARRVYAERHGLESWKREALQIRAWWDEIDTFIRKHRDAPLGLNVSDITLGWLKERDTLKHDLASARFAASGFETEAKKERARLDHLIDQAYDHKKCDSPEEVYLSILRGTNTASVRTIIDSAMLTSTAQEGK